MQDNSPLPKLKSYLLSWIKVWIKTTLRTILIQLVAWTLGLLLIVGLCAGAYFYVKNLLVTKTPASLQKVAKAVVSSKSVVLKENKAEPVPANHGQKLLQAFPQLGSFLQTSNLVSAGQAYDAGIEARPRPVARLELRKDPPDGEPAQFPKSEVVSREHTSGSHEGLMNPNETNKSTSAEVHGTGFPNP